MKEILDKIKIALGDKKDDVSSYAVNTLSDWIHVQYQVTEDIKKVLLWLQDSPQNKYRMHRLQWVFHHYFTRCESIDQKIMRNETIEASARYDLNAVRKELIEVIQVLYTRDPKRLLSVQEQFVPIIAKLNFWDVAGDTPDLLDKMKQQSIIKQNILTMINHWFRPDTTQFHDWIHRLKWSIEVYFMGCEHIIKFIQRWMEYSDQRMIDTLEIVNTNKLELISIIKSLDTMNVDIQEKTWMADIISYIRSKFSDGEIDIDDNTYILCSKRVFKWIIDELRENYRKYGTNWYISIGSEENMLVISLKNKKKEKDIHDFSSKSGLKIFEKYMKELWGSFTCDFSTEDCTTIIRLPLYNEGS